jgi:hypothetical protein
MVVHQAATLSGLNHCSAPDSRMKLRWCSLARERSCESVSSNGGKCSSFVFKVILELRVALLRWLTLWWGSLFRHEELEAQFLKVFSRLDAIPPGVFLTWCVKLFHPLTPLCLGTHSKCLNLQMFLPRRSARQQFRMPSESEQLGPEEVLVSMEPLLLQV